MQEGNKLVPNNSEFLCLLAKQWSDLTFYHGISAKEKPVANAKAMEYSQQVRGGSWRWRGRQLSGSSHISHSSHSSSR